MATEQVAELYRQAFAEHGRSVNAIFIPKGRQQERFEAITRHFEDGFSILDFGCGLGDLRTYLATRFNRFDYTGADIMEGFVESNCETHPQGSFIHIRDFADIETAFDHVVICGTFNIDYFGDEIRHARYVKDALAHLWNKTKRSLSVDFMHTEVDFRAPRAYHQDIAEIEKFAHAEFGERVIIDRSYLPYEFALTVLRY